jgi:hypothetical protein
MTSDLEIVDVLIPVRPNVVYRRHARHYTIAGVRLPSTTLGAGSRMRRRCGSPGRTVGPRSHD